jgi:hypothetical protein
LASRSVTGPDESKAQNGAYLDFVYALHGHAARHPHVRYRAGNAFGFGCAFVSLVTLLGLLAAYVSLLSYAVVRGRELYATHGVFAAPLAIVIPFLFHWVRRSKPASYSADSLPEELLPRRQDE